MFQALNTDRFFLQEITMEDQAFIFEGLSHPQVIPYYGISFNSFEETKAQMNFYRDMQEQETGTWWKIVCKESGNKLGAIGFNNYQKQHRRAEIGYWLLPAHWGKKIIAEVLPVITNHMFQTKKIHRIEALVESGNVASNKVLVKAGFTHEGLLRDYEIKKGAYISLSVFSLLSTDALKTST